MNATQHPHASSVRSVAALAGLLAVALYVVGVVVGGLVTQGYNHIVDATSELMLAGAPHRLGISVLFACYNIALAAFALALPAAVTGSGRAVRVGSWLLLAISVAGLGMILFPTDRPTDPFIVTGWIHIGFASVASLGSMAAILSVGLGLRGRPEWRGFSAFSVRRARGDLRVRLGRCTWRGGHVADNGPRRTGNHRRLSCLDTRSRRLACEPARPGHACGLTATGA